MTRKCDWLMVLLLLFACVDGVQGDGVAALGLKPGKVALQSAGPLAFGPAGVLFVGDPKGATLFALDTGDASGDPSHVSLTMEKLDSALGELLQVRADQVALRDMAVNPLSGQVYLTVMADKMPALVRIDSSGALSRLSLDNIAHSSVALADAPEDGVVGEGRRQQNPRDASITDLAYVDGQVIVSGLRKAAAPSGARALVFPFVKADPGASLEIYHGAHGKSENYAPIQTFVAMSIDGEPSVLAGFTCTPLVKFPIKSIHDHDTIQGTTVAELGNRNRPLDMIVYNQNGKSFVLMANSARGVMKISTDDLQRSEGITEPVSGGGTAGPSYETISDLQGVVQLDRLNETHALIVVQDDAKGLNLRTVALP